MRTLTKAILTLLLATASQAQAIMVFACEPEWASLTRTLMPEANVRTATTHLQDPHHIEARPSLIAHLRNADFVVCTGAELEAGWLPMLQEKSGNPKAQNGRSTVFFAAQHVELIDPYKGLITPFVGDVHAQGNPHVHTDPRKVLQVAKALASRLMKVFPEKKPAIERNLIAFEAELQTKIAAWEQQARALRGKGIITQHASFGYLWEWLGIHPVADLEPKPGMPPTVAHLDKVLTLSKSQQPIGIIIAQHHDPKPAHWLAANMGMQSRLLVVPSTVMEEQTGAMVKWFDLLVNQLTSLVR